MRAQQLILSAIAFNILSGPLAANDAQNGIPSGELFRTEVAASTNPLIANSKYQIWIPDDASTFRTLFVFNMRGAGKHLFASDHEWRALAKRTQSAMLYCEFEAHGVRDNGYASSMLKACEQFAAELNLPELPQAPFVLWGHSMGGRVAQDFVRFRPGRVLAFHIAAPWKPQRCGVYARGSRRQECPRPLPHGCQRWETERHSRTLRTFTQSEVAPRLGLASWAESLAERHALQEEPNDAQGLARVGPLMTS